MKKVRIEHHKQGYYELRSAPGVVADLESRGNDLLAEVGGESAGYKMSSEQGAKRPFGRWRVSVFTMDFDAILDNARNNSLLNALGRGGS